MRRTSIAGAAIDWQRYETLQRTGEDAFLANDFRSGRQEYTDATALGEELLKRADQTVEGALAAAARSVRGRQRRARAEAVRHRARHRSRRTRRRKRVARARSGCRRCSRSFDARTRSAARGELEASRRELSRGARDRRGMGAGAHAPSPRSPRQLKDNEFEQRMSAGSSALAAEEFAEAEKQFRAALALRPKRHGGGGRV